LVFLIENPDFEGESFSRQVLPSTRLAGTAPTKVEMLGKLSPTVKNDSKQ
jgi:hypothetical protein